MITRRRAQTRDYDSEVRRAALLLETVDTYRARGWSPFPLEPGKKEPPPSGVTGYSAKPITDSRYRRWAGMWGNLALVMPDGVVGIDIDLYKPGNSMPRDLPPTAWSGNRHDGSGIYMFAVPPGTRLDGSIPGVGEAVQWFHRYAVVWPSIHPEGRRYVWRDGNDELADIPYVDDLPFLPEIWLKRLAERSRKRSGGPTGKGFKGDAEEWFDTIQKGPMTPAVCSALRESIRALDRHLVDGGARYDIMNRGMGNLVGLGANRHRGVERAIDELAGAYLDMLDGTPDRDPASEIARSLAGAISKWGGRR